MDSPQIIVVGSFVQDLTFHCPEFPRPGETVIGQFLTGPGGKGSNQAVAAARAGGKVAFIGAVGRDAFGAGARAFQEGEGIRWLVAEKADRPTGAAGILVDSHGQNEIIVSLDANNALTPADIDAHADIFHHALVMVGQLEANLEAQAHAMRLARGSNITVILNPAPMRSDFDLKLLADVHILIPNETEFCTMVNLLPQTVSIVGAGFSERKLAALTDADLHALCRQFNIETVIVTLGARGCFISHLNDYIMIPAMQGIVAVDTTGAGDAFVGAFAGALARLGPEEVEEAASFANAAAALSVTKRGTAPAMPRREEIDALRMEQA